MCPFIFGELAFSQIDQEGGSVKSDAVEETESWDEFDRILHSNMKHKQKEQQVSTVCLIALLTLLQLTSSVASQQVTKLQKLDIYPDSITLSGFSSGGTFAQQLQFSYSSLFSGIAVFAHAYYRCSPGDGITASYDAACSQLGDPTATYSYDPSLALQDIQDYFSQGLIENPQNLRDTRLYVYAGTRNFAFSADQSLRILNIYESFIESPLNIQTRVQASSLALPTHHFGGDCGNFTASKYFLSNCGLSGPFEALSFLLGSESVRHEPFSSSKTLQPLEAFDQTEFFPEVRHDMDTIGYLYVPSYCRTNRCFLHFYFHGCRSGRQFLEQNHIVNTGYLELAELNNIIIVFPQALNSTENRGGCWDTYGVTGRLYATQRGGQVTVVHNMILRILGQDKIETADRPNVRKN